MDIEIVGDHLGEHRRNTSESPALDGCTDRVGEVFGRIETELELITEIVKHRGRVDPCPSQPSCCGYKGGSWARYTPPH